MKEDGDADGDAGDDGPSEVTERPKKKTAKE
jgi:hypothetical protein